MNTPELTNTPEITQPPESSLLQDFAALLRYWAHAAWTRIGRRRALILLGITLAGAGIAFNWSWLAAIGVAPIILSLAPCAAMCALGLCMNKMAGSKSCSTGQQADQGSRETPAQKPEADRT
jgi:hypothetical protein